MQEKVTLDNILDKVDYSKLHTNYVPSEAALTFLAFIKMVEGDKGAENKSPVIHMSMIDALLEDDSNLFVSFRGSAKTTLLHEYMFLYIATYGEFFNFGKVNVGMYISDTIDNGVKSMRKQLQYRWENSDFLQQMVPIANFTDVRWEFENISGKKVCFRGFGANTGVRGFKEYGERPTWAALDDLMSDKNAESPTIIQDITNIIYKAARQAMHPKKRKMVWTGTPFNQKDPLNQAAGTKAWHTKAFPICQKFPCEREEFIGAWEDRFNYDFVKAEYERLLEAGQIAAFNQELMLRIVSKDEQLIIPEIDIRWYSLRNLLAHKSDLLFYITTDFATSERQKADYSVISVWGLNSNNHWFWVDGMRRRQGMDKNIEDLFKFAQKWNPESVGIEVSGQQGGFIPWVEQEMVRRNTFFTLASNNNQGAAGIRPSTQKLQRFNVVQPWFKQGRMHFPEEYKTLPIMSEGIEELSLITPSGCKSKNDDFIDTVSMLGVMNAYPPGSAEAQEYIDPDLIDLGYYEEETTSLDSYIY